MYEKFQSNFHVFSSVLMQCFRLSDFTSVVVLYVKMENTFKLFLCRKYSHFHVKSFMMNSSSVKIAFPQNLVCGVWFVGRCIVKISSYTRIDDYTRFSLEDYVKPPTLFCWHRKIAKLKQKIFPQRYKKLNYLFACGA